jgi:hypothetical protein
MNKSKKLVPEAHDNIPTEKQKDFIKRVRAAETTLQRIRKKSISLQDITDDDFDELLDTID